MYIAIDSHIHGDILIQKDKNFPKIYYEKNIGGIIWAYNEKINNVQEYIDYWDFLKDTAYKISTESSPFFYKIGIHPRTICEELKEKKYISVPLKKAFDKHLSDTRCLGIGEIGLDTEDTIEEEIFISHLMWCKNYLPDNKRIGIHTPRKNKKEITKKIVGILKDFDSLLSQIVIDHVELTTIDLVKDLNTYIGMTLQIGKSKGEDIKKVVLENLYPIDKILLNSDGGKEISQPYIDFVSGDFCDRDIKQRLLRENIKVFYNL